jgi:hypothetical protein
MARILIENQTVWLQIPISIMLDGAEAVTIRFNDKVELVVNDGDHSLQARMGDAMSSQVNFHADRLRTLGFACSASGVADKLVFLKQI